MKTRQLVAAALVATLSGVPAHLVAAQSTITLKGTAKDEARRPYPDYSARARELDKGQVVVTAALDTSGNFSLTAPPSKYVIELVDRGGRVVCTEGPFDMTKTALKDDVDVDCDKVPAAWWLLGAAAAAGITAGVVTAPPASPAR